MFKKASLLVLALSITTSSVQASTVFSGTDASPLTTNSVAALNAWKAAVGGNFQSDNVNGWSGNGTTTTAGNKFTLLANGSLVTSTLNSGVISGAAVRANRNTSNNNPVSFQWDLATPSRAFGFNSKDNDGGTITVTYVGGATETFVTAGGSFENSFWGITNLNNFISSVKISTTDPPGVSYWDNFVTSQVPEPSSLALLGLGVIGMAYGVRRRNRKVA